MLDYAIAFYNNHIILFYLLLILTVIIEWPITILAISLVSSRLWIGFLEILFFSFIWDFAWDMIHYIVWKFFKSKILKNDFSLVQKTQERLKGHSLLDKLIVIKYTPPITSIWLIYLWYINTNFKKFLKNDFLLCVFSSIFITSIWYNFWHIFRNQDDFKYLIIGLFLSFVVFYVLLKIFTKYLINKIYE